MIVTRYLSVSEFEALFAAHFERWLWWSPSTRTMEKWQADWQRAMTLWKQCFPDMERPDRTTLRQYKRFADQHEPVLGDDCVEKMRLWGQWIDEKHPNAGQSYDEFHATKGA